MGRRTGRLAVAVLAAGIAAGGGCAPRAVLLEEGTASWYGPGFAGRRTASGERFCPEGRTAAHRTLPFGTRVRVTRVETGARVTVRINDRGPAPRDRVIDLSKGAARALGMLRAGLAEVKIEVLRPRRRGEGEPPPPAGADAGDQSP